MQDSEIHSSKLFLAFAGILLAVGTLMVYSASMSSRSVSAEQTYLLKHAIFLVLALLSGAIASQLPSWLWYKLAPYLYFVSVMLLIAVLVPGVGHRVNGAQRWLRLGPISLQPSELLKLTIPMIVCRFRFNGEGNLNSLRLRQTATLLLLIGLPLGLVLVEPDLGTAVFIGTIAAIALFLSRWPLRYFVFMIALTVPAIAGLITLRPYQLARVQGFIQTWTNPDAAPYQVQQSLTTLGVGGLQGEGLGRGWQKLSFLPEANTDFIFSVIGEELGLLGTLGVIVLWLGLYLSGLKLIRSSRQNTFESVVATTLLTQLVLQAAMNVAVVTAMLPPKGISHPLISYGGSNLVTSVTALGIILSLTRNVVEISEPIPAEQPIEFDLPATSDI